MVHLYSYIITSQVSGSNSVARDTNDRDQRQAHLALEYLPEQDLHIRRVIAAIALGDAYAIKGDMPAAYLAQSGAIETSRSAGNIYFVIIANLKMALTLREQARLQRTIAKFYPVIMPFCIRPGRI